MPPTTEEFEEAVALGQLLGAVDIILCYEAAELSIDRADFERVRRARENFERVRTRPRTNLEPAS